jgi:uncharacterized RmlC-like cupin family protein
MEKTEPVPVCRVVRSSQGFTGKQGLDYFAGVSSESVGAIAICMHMLVLPPGARAKAHYHESHETAIFVLEGTVEFFHGANLECHDIVTAGDYVYIPAGVPHLPFNASESPARAIIARTDPNEQESVVTCEHLERTRP